MLHAHTTATNRLPLFALLIGNAVSMAGNTLAALAIPWFVLQTTGSAAKMGLTAFVAVLPTIVAAFFGGTIVDRLGYRRASVIADLSSGITVALAPLLHATLGLAFWQLLALVFLGALLDVPGTTARTALLPDLAVLARMPLERVNAASQAIERGTSLLSAPLAGVLIVMLEPMNVLWIDAGTFAFSAVLVILTIPRVAAASAAESSDSSYLSELRAGVRFIQQDQLVRTIIAIVIMTNFLDSPLFSIVMPIFAHQVLGSASDFGLMVAAWGGGSLAGALIFGAIGHRLPRRRTFISAFLILGMPLWMLALLPGLPMAMAALAIMGLAAAPINPILRTALQERVPATIRGRVFGTFTAGAYIAIPLGALLTGYLLAWIGLRATLLTQAACYLMVTMSLLFHPALRSLNAPARSAIKRQEAAG